MDKATKLLKNFYKGNDNVYIRKLSKYGISKKQFLDNSLNNQALLNDVMELQKKNNNVTTIDPNSDLNKQMVDIISKHASDKITVKHPQIKQLSSSKTMPYKVPEKAKTPYPMTAITNVFGKKASDNLQAKLDEKMKPKGPTITQEDVDRMRGHAPGGYIEKAQTHEQLIMADPNPFSKIQYDEKYYHGKAIKGIAPFYGEGIRRSYVAGHMGADYEKYAKEAEIEYETKEGKKARTLTALSKMGVKIPERMNIAGVGGTKTGTQTLEEILQQYETKAPSAEVEGAMGEFIPIIIPNSFRVQQPQFQNWSDEQIQRWVIDPQGYSAYLVGGGTNIPHVDQVSRLMYDSWEQGQRPADPEVRPADPRLPPEQLIPHDDPQKVHLGPQQFGPGMRGKTATAQRVPEVPPGSQTQTETSSETEQKTATKTKQDFPTIPVETKTDEDDEKKKEKEKEKPRPPPEDPRDPPPDPDERRRKKDDEKKSTPTEFIPQDLKYPELRPYFNVGGEDVLRISKERAKQELTDWNLYSFVPGEVYESDDNPMTQHQRRQYYYRMQNTKPPPQPYKPKKFTGRAPTTYMRNQYQSYQPFFDANDRTQYAGRTMEYYQDRTTASDLLDMGDRGYANPDMLQRAYPNGRHYGPAITKTNLMLGRKSFF